MENYSLSDLRAAVGEDGGFGGNGAWWIIILFLFMFSNGGFGFGGRGTEIQNGFDTAEITRKLDGITNGLADGFYAQNTTMLNGFAGVTAAVNESRFAAQNCCCETNRNIDGVKYDLSTAIHAEGEATRALIRENEIQALRDKVHYLEQNAALCGVVRYPTAMTYNAGGSPFCATPCGCTNI